MAIGGLGIRVVTIVRWVIGGGRINMYGWENECNGCIINCLLRSWLKRFKGENARGDFFLALVNRELRTPCCWFFEVSRNESFVCFRLTPSCCVFAFDSFVFSKFNEFSSAGLAAISPRIKNKAVPKRIPLIRGFILARFMWRKKVSIELVIRVIPFCLRTTKESCSLIGHRAVHLQSYLDPLLWFINKKSF